MNIGKRIKSIRERLGMSQVDFADKINVSKQTLYKYENDIITNIPSDKIENIASLGNVSPAYIMGWVDDNGDSLIDYYDNTLNDAVSFLKKNGYIIVETNSPDDDTIIIKNRSNQIIKTITEGDLVNQYEQLKVKDLPKTVENLLNIKSTDILPESIRAAARGMLDLSPDDQKTAIDMINYLSQKGREARKS